MLNPLSWLKSKPAKVKLMIMESGKLTEHNLGLIDDMKLEITHDGKSITLSKDEILPKIFTERGWHGNAKGHYVFCKFESGELKLIGLEDFNPSTAFSAEEAGLMVHESVTIRGAKNLVSRIKGKGSSHKLLIFVIILVAVISIVYLKMQGMI